ncbi:HPP family protein [Erwinia sp. 198]|uniref:HPP family protein n=1 Tax=Erwinia sp. 198 TaxID=2022746 RepID=UPI000F67AE61|nr:HPP family protein [Erwinia sp. 198]RRZ95530.1 HPP family protein [Erwinia sp. 198]
MITVSQIKHFIERFWPRPVVVAPRQIILSSLGTFTGLLFASLFSHWTLGEVNVWFIAPMGASAVLLFAASNSPLAQPWSVIGGNFVSALTGLTVAHYIEQPVIGAALAAGLSVVLMFKLRCLHPPGGAIALTAVMGSHAAGMSGYHFAFVPVLLNSVSLTLVAILFNNLIGRRYPHTLSAAETLPKPVQMEVAISRQDLHEALMKGEFLDIDEEDLQQVLQQAENIALARQAGKTVMQQAASERKS